MAVSRGDLRAYAATQWPGLVTLAGMETGDTQNGFKLPIDSVLRKLGYSNSLLSVSQATDDEAEGAYALMDYYTLLHFSKRFASRRDANVSGSGGVDFKKRTERVQLREDLTEAEERCQALGYDVGGSAWDAGTMHADYLAGSSGRSGW